jgi:hypothetical protein
VPKGAGVGKTDLIGPEPMRRMASIWLVAMREASNLGDPTPKRFLTTVSRSSRRIFKRPDAARNLRDAQQQTILGERKADR